MKHPKHGGRVLLERGEVSDERVAYAITLYSPDAAWTAVSAVATTDGAVELGSWEGEGEPPQWLVDAALAFLRTVWNGRRRESPPRWPERVLRWRAEK